MKGTRYIFVSGFGTGPEVWSQIILKLQARSEYFVARGESPPSFLPLPFWSLLLPNLPESLDGFLQNSEGLNLVLCGWSAGATLLLGKLSHLFPYCKRIVLLSFSPRMLEDKGYSGYKRSTFNSMRRALATDKHMFLSGFFGNVCSTHKNVARQELLIKQALQIDDGHLLNGLDFLDSFDTRIQFASLLAGESLLHAGCGVSRPNIVILQGLHDTVVPHSHLAYFQGKNPEASDVLVDKNGIPVSRYSLGTSGHVHQFNLQCGHDILFEQEECVLDALIGR